MKIYSNIPKHLVAVDCIIFGYDIIEKEIKLLLVKRNLEPARTMVACGRLCYGRRKP